MACSTCAANAAKKAKVKADVSFYGRYLNPDTGRFQKDPIPDQESVIICDYEKSQLELKLSELESLVKIEQSIKNKKRLYNNIATLKLAIRYYDNNCLQYIFALDEIFKN